MTETTTRLGLPLLVAGQGQKDVTHNEALLALDMLLHPSVRSRSVLIPPEAPDAGSCWLVPAGAEGAWSGRGGAIACWTDGGWRIRELPEGASVAIEDEAVRLRLAGGAWSLEAPRNFPAAPIQDPVGGSIIDGEARATVSAILARLTQLGLLSA